MVYDVREKENEIVKRAVEAELYSASIFIFSACHIFIAGRIR